MSKELRSLLMRANRLLGAQLVEHNLVKIEDLESASEKFIEIVSSGQRRRCSILAVLAYEMKVIGEDALLNYQVETDGLGLVDLRDYEIPDEIRKATDQAACWATWSVPFDREEEFTFVATAYYLSPAVRAHWEKEMGGRVLWFGTSLEAIADYLEHLASQTSVTQTSPGLATAAQ